MCATSYPRSLVSASGGRRICCTARTATGGRLALSRSGFWRTHPGSVQHALLVRQWSDDVIFFGHTNELTSAESNQVDACGVRIVSREVARLVVDADRLTGVELVDRQVFARTAMFIRPGNVSRADGLLTGLGCGLNEADVATVDATGRTSTAGVWAAGNVVDPRAQVRWSRCRRGRTSASSDRPGR